MKNFLPLFLICITPGFAYGVGSYSKDLYGDLNIRTNHSFGDMYAGIRGSLSFLNWQNKYKDEMDVQLEAESFNFKSMVGVNVFVGYQSIDKWRTDLEFGYVGKYSEGETEYYTEYNTEKTKFDLETFYLMANGYYDLKNGLYAGLGAGLAFVNTSIDTNVIAGNSATKVSPMGAIMVGWSHKLDEKVTFDLRYRFAAFHGGNLNIDTGAGTYIKTEIGFIKDNSLSAGIRYTF
jgi:opacity protein-like surface antigen